MENEVVYGLEAMVMKKEVLLAALKKNRETHRAVFLEAQQGYRQAVIRELDEMLADARANRRLRKIIELEEPEDHTKDYDRIILMLEHSVGTCAKITQSEFSQYVLDDWRWKQDWVTSTQGYLATR